MKHLKPNSWCAIPGCSCGGKPQDDTYNGWANYETWNVALWIENDEFLYQFAKARKNKGYHAFTEELRLMFTHDFGKTIAFETPDGVAWNDSGLDIEALDEMMGEL